MMLAEGAFAAATVETASAAFFTSAKARGASYLQTRLYRRPAQALTSESHWAAGGVIARFAPDDWPGSPAFDYVCFECNPLLDAIRGSRTRYRFSDFAPKAEARYGAYWEALSQARIGEALCATSYGAGRTIASLHLGFEDPKLSEADTDAIQLGGLLLTERLMMLAEPPEPDTREPVSLTPRERDALAWVAEGKSDWEISVILGLSEATARWHVDNARRKLSAVNRAQAVARAAAAGMI
jgi:DNA-binding CsgD family transcriptional regulator